MPLECLVFRFVLAACVVCLTGIAGAVGAVPLSPPATEVSADPMVFVQPHMAQVLLDYLANAGVNESPDVVRMVLQLVDGMVNSENCTGVVCICTVVKELLNRTGVLPPERCHVCLAIVSVDDFVTFGVSDPTYDYYGIRVLKSPNSLAQADQPNDYAIMKIAKYSQVGGSADCSSWDSADDA
jgi:hypothetical protein